MGERFVATFELFHLSLIERDRDLFTALDQRPSREDWLRKAFSETFTFEHRARKFYWVPFERVNELVIGHVTRTHKRTHHAPPEDGAIEIVTDEWQGSLVLVDPASHEDGQKVAFERDPTIGRPRAVLQSLLAHVNMVSGAEYAVEPKPIFDENSFWAWSTAHENKLRRITFDFVVPNMWESATNLDEELRELRSIGVQRAKVTYEGPDEIDATSSQIKDGVDYASKGGGTLTAKAKNGDTYASTEKTKTAKLPTTSAEVGGVKDAITKWSRKLLGREQSDDVASPDRAVSDPAVD
jgi:hypothetical protein